MQIRTNGFVVCVKNAGYSASLEVRKLYPFLADADAELEGFLRVVDESGEDYLYPAKMFRKLSIPADLRRVLRVAS